LSPDLSGEALVFHHLSLEQGELQAGKREGDVLTFGLCMGRGCTLADDFFVARHSTKLRVIIDQYNCSLVEVFA
jgi:hypothetical protein